MRLFLVQQFLDDRTLLPHLIIDIMGIALGRDVTGVLVLAACRSRGRKAISGHGEAGRHGRNRKVGRGTCAARWCVGTTQWERTENLRQTPIWH